MTESEYATIVIKVVFAILSVAITYYVIPFLSELTEQYRDTKIEKFVFKAVKAVEQVIKGDKMGAIRKERVLKMTSDWLLKNHIEMSEEEIDNLIESLVYSMNHPEETVK